MTLNSIEMDAIDGELGVSEGRERRLSTTESKPDRPKTEDKTTRNVFIRRPAFTQEKFHERYEFEPPRRSPIPFINNHRIHGRSMKDSGGGMSSILTRKLRHWHHDLSNISCQKLIWQFFPILNWLPKYKFRQLFLNDVIAGFTVGVMHVPQGLAYAMLAQIDAICGIYTAFFPVIIYMLLGTSRHISMGSFAVISILVSKPVIQHCQSTPGNVTSVGLDDDVLAASDLSCELKVTLAVTFCVGVIQFIMGLMRLGVLSALLSDALVSGFTTGAAMHVLTSQIPHIFGFRVPKYIGVGRLFKSYIAIAKKLPETNFVALGISVCCLAILLLHDFLIKPLVSKKCHFPIPIQFLLVVMGTIVAWLLDLRASYGLYVVEDVPSGMPSPYVPFTDLDLLGKVFVDSIGIALIGYVISLSMSRMLAAKHKYQVDPNQELVAQGASNLFGSFFSSLPMAGSLSRSMIQDSTGGKTMITSAVSVFMLLWVILFIGPLFYHLPRAVLSCIIVVSLFGIFSQFRYFMRFARRSLSEGFVWMATFSTTVLLDVDFGLIVGLGVSVLFLIAWGYFPKIELVGRTEYQDIFVQADSFQSGLYYDDPILVRVSGNLNMANATSLVNQIEGIFDDEEPGKTWTDHKNATLILDISSVTHVDSSACQNIVEVYKHFIQLGQIVAFIGIRAEVWSRFEACSVFDEIPREQFYPTVQDALVLLQTR